MPITVSAIVRDLQDNAAKHLPLTAADLRPIVTAVLSFLALRMLDHPYTGEYDIRKACNDALKTRSR